jgi:hypothetical protein
MTPDIARTVLHRSTGDPCWDSIRERVATDVDRSSCILAIHWPWPFLRWIAAGAVSVIHRQLRTVPVWCQFTVVCLYA